MVGARLVELGLESGRFLPVAIAHSTGNAWRLARRGIPVKMCNTLDPQSIQNALAGCDIVVNATRGDDTVMLKGLENLLAEARTAGVRRFIHLSSILVYGNPPHSTSVTEAGQETNETSGYGAVKLAQDRMIARASESGLSSIILCPPNIGGVGSHFMLNLVNSIGAGRIAVVDGEPTVCTLVDVDNLCNAIEIAFEKGSDNGERFFVFDEHPLTWPDLLTATATALDLPKDFVNVSRSEVRARWDQFNRPPPRGSPKTLLKLLSSSPMREAMRKDPFYFRLESKAKKVVRNLVPRAETKILLATDGTPSWPRRDSFARFDVPLLFQQLREVRHSDARARQTLGYAPAHSTRSSVDAFAGWYRTLAGWDRPQFSDMSRLATLGSASFMDVSGARWPRPSALRAPLQTTP